MFVGCFLFGLVGFNLDHLWDSLADDKQFKRTRNLALLKLREAHKELFIIKI